MSGSPQVTNASAFEKKSLGIQIVLAIVTLGLYTIYWHYSTAKQLSEGTNYDISPGLVTIAIFIPFGVLYTWWKTANAAEAVTDQSAVIMFVLFLIFAPISWYWVQAGMNSVAPA
ncbi:hypothetical protein BRC65_07985 [Halobacteriales archaeon QH_2_65_14]|nr:MAG: hypothetical protein BRC65_07985 [Halobacteriales archaeon QH_2_65_14]